MSRTVLTGSEGASEGEIGEGAVDVTELHLFGYAAAVLIGLGVGIEREHNVGTESATGAESRPVEPPGART
ncbi:hypothetical protein JWS13_01075 (plasmid) [Rhodococcus pseudokoreensis]|uniref:Uncharacterized protein n=1 Tax=Rhodococcus pseudokoreensis TaxID=2811421 RepID=A0A974VYS1_9NOCA|nr:hypothetical protein [Rhodococcus pseudokoreensis]QSE87512.1 hypothetical protein JWS13_01075 [Rhodococcus pseudokoreensis]